MMPTGCVLIFLVLGILSPLSSIEFLTSGILDIGEIITALLSLLNSSISPPDYRHFDPGPATSLLLRLPSRSSIPDSASWPSAGLWKAALSWLPSIEDASFRFLVVASVALPGTKACDAGVGRKAGADRGRH